MAKFFLSYTAKDREYAHQLAKALRSRAHDVYYDHNLRPGENWRAMLRQRLADADVAVIVITEAALESPWVSHEAGAAVAYAAERSRPTVVPVVLGRAQLPVALADIQAIYARGDDGNPARVAEELISALPAIVGGQEARATKRREVTERIERTAELYINRSITELRARETVYRRVAYGCYVMAYLTLAGAVAVAISQGSRELAKTPSDWRGLAAYGAVGVVVLGLLIALAKYVFVLGRSFMVESIRHADRRHAIAFGEFYMKAFQEDMQWDQLKEAFQHWNFDRPTIFGDAQSREFDPLVMSLAREFANALREVKDARNRTSIRPIP